VISGLEVPEAGRVFLDERDATEASLRDRNVGFVFKHYALFRHMSVFENVAFGLRVRARKDRPAEPLIRERVGRLLELVQLEAYADRLPSQLSGGQRQRVALARALAVEPKVLLLDEPFGSLDAKVRKELRRWLRRLHDDLHVTSVFVTHDQEEALELADRVVIMNQGRIEQVGTPDEVYTRPASPFVFQFLGDVNLFHARVEGTHAQVLVRPHLLTISHSARGHDEFPARVVRVNAAGPLVRVDLVSALGEPVRVEITQERLQELQLQRDSEVFVGFDAADAYVAD
jgi:sulfate transport system ATP-binding protein